MLYPVFMHTLTDRVAVVTGAGSGIGRAVAVALSREGCRVALVDVNEHGLAATAELLETAHSLHVVDVSDKEQMQALPAAVADELGFAHIVVNNAGVTVEGTFREQTVEDVEHVLGVNFWGVYYGCSSSCRTWSGPTRPTSSTCPRSLGSSASRPRRPTAPASSPCAA